MFISVILSLLLGFTTLAQARSMLGRCEPTVKLSPSYMTCKNKEIFYSITFDTLVSPLIQACEGVNSRENTTASIEISNEKGEVLSKVVLYDGNFTSTSSIGGDGTFQSELLSLNLKGCVSPVHGGFSVGN